MYGLGATRFWGPVVQVALWRLVFYFTLSGYGKNVIIIKLLLFTYPLA
ncbi:hypothetical protein N752_17030 [Desulforamulus aquiferis]|nr:hypothetical protein N752_17030 [Desulforamulus aquiferis]